MSKIMTHVEATKTSGTSPPIVTKHLARYVTLFLTILALGVGSEAVITGDFAGWVPVVGGHELTDSVTDLVKQNSQWCSQHYHECMSGQSR